MLNKNSTIYIRIKTDAVKKKLKLFVLINYLLLNGYRGENLKFKLTKYAKIQSSIIIKIIINLGYFFISGIDIIGIQNPNISIINFSVDKYLFK